MDLFLIGAPVLDVSQQNAVVSIERDYRSFLEAENRHLVRKLKKSLKRKNIAASLAHASRYLFLSGIEIDLGMQSELVIEMALKDYEGKKRNG